MKVSDNQLFPLILLNIRPIIIVVTIYTGVKLVEYFGDARAYVGSAYMVSDVLAAILVTTLPWSNKIGLLISVYLTGTHALLFSRTVSLFLSLGRHWDDRVRACVGLGDF